jgi:alpha-glucuronidase
MVTGPARAQTVAALMMRSREAVVDYMTPLGLHHIMGTGHHHGPAPWVDNLERPDWNPVYYHRAGPDGIGFERSASGSNAVSQYASEVARRLARIPPPRRPNCCSGSTTCPGPTACRPAARCGPS